MASGHAERTTVHDKWVDRVADLPEVLTHGAKQKDHRLWEQHCHSKKRPLLVYHFSESQINP